jgi:hypothetical protein
VVSWVRCLMLDDADGSSLLAAFMSAVVEQLKRQIDVAAANEVHWGSRYVLVVAVLHFPELGIDLEVLGSRRGAGLIEDEVDALWSKVRVATDSLESHVPSSVARNPPDGAGSSGASLYG